MAIVPSLGYKVVEERMNDVNVRLWYNKYTVSPTVVNMLFSYCKHSWTRLNDIFADVQLPLNKLDYVTIPDFKVQGWPKINNN